MAKSFGVLIRFNMLPDDVTIDDVKRMASDIVMGIPEGTEVPGDGQCLNIDVGNVRRIPGGLN